MLLRLGYCQVWDAWTKPVCQDQCDAGRGLLWVPGTSDGPQSCQCSGSTARLTHLAWGNPAAS